MLQVLRKKYECIYINMQIAIRIDDIWTDQIQVAIAKLDKRQKFIPHDKCLHIGDHVLINHIDKIGLHVLSIHHEQVKLGLDLPSQTFVCRKPFKLESCVNRAA
jgi:sRNA-binding carbon storage regulator CsrA